MPVLRRLFQVGSMADSMGWFVPATALGKGIGLARLLVLLWLMKGVQYNLWAAGAMIFDLAAPLLCWGSLHGLGRYVSLYEARGQVREFYRRVRWVVPVLCLAMTAVAMLGSDAIRRAAIEAKGSTISFDGQMLACWAAIGNAALMALYLNLLSFLYGLRAYRLASTVELAFAVLFTGLGVGFMLWRPDAVTLLAAHGACLAVVLVAGVVVLEVAFRRGWVGADEHRQTASPPDATGIRSGWLTYGAAALAANVLWNLVGYLSYRLTSRQSEDAGAMFQAYLRLDQQVAFLAAAAWAVVFSHVARLYESDRTAAWRSLGLAFKAVSTASISLGVLMYLSAPLWVHVLREEYRAGIDMVGPLLMFFQTLSGLFLMSLVSRLHERPWAMAIVSLEGGACNVLLAAWWMPHAGALGAAWAAGVGVFVGGMAVTLWYFRRTGVRMDRGVWLMYGMSPIFLLPAWLAAVVWAGLCVWMLATNSVFSAEDKHRLRESVARWIRH